MTSNHNKIYVVATLTIYVGLALIGGAPEVLAGEGSAKNLNAPALEFSVRAEGVSAKIKFRQKSEKKSHIPISNPGIAFREVRAEKLEVLGSAQNLVSEDIKPGYTRIISPTCLPRASL
ncbi:MAG: hypothetical protein R2684_14090 [Pyrinomonadaceae bacterium]